MSIELGLGDGNAAGKVVAAILFVQASTNTMDVYSAVNSSPWTAQSFGADPEKRKACMEYVHQSLAITAFYNFTAAAIAQSWWPIIGWALASGYMYWLYKRALARAEETGSTSWGSSSSQSTPSWQPQAVGGIGF